MTRPRDWTPGPIAVALTAATVAVGALWLSYDRWPRGTAHAALWAVLTAACVWRANRNLRAEMDAARRLLDAWNSSEARDELALSPPAGTPSVELYDQDAVSAYYPLPDTRPTMPVITATGGPDDGIHFAPMTVAETDRLVAQLQALPGEDVIDSTEIPRGQGLARLAAASAAQEAALAYIRDHYDVPAYACGHVTVDGRQGIITGAQDGHLLVVFTGADEHPMPCHPTWRVVYDRSDWHLGQPCARCDAPATAWVSDRPGPEISDVTFLCDECYAERVSEEVEG